MTPNQNKEALRLIKWCDDRRDDQEIGEHWRSTMRDMRVLLAGLVEGRECRCTFRQKALGDGCAVCNPELAASLQRSKE